MKVLPHLRCRLSDYISCFTALLLAYAAVPGHAQGVETLIRSAKPGSTIRIPAGVHRVGGVAVPSNVRLVGEGVGRTVILAEGHEFGLLLSDAAAVQVSDLSVHGATNANIAIQSSSQVTIERVSSEGASTGILCRSSRDTTIRSVLSARNAIGISIIEGERVGVANCTLADNTRMGLVMAKSSDSVVFNSILAGSPIGVSLDDASKGVALDYNLYSLEIAGAMPGQAVRQTLFGWQKLTGHDAHSLHLQVDFSDPKSSNYTPKNELSWMPGRIVSADWGIDSLNGVEAAGTDLTGTVRSGGIDLGAVEVVAGANRSPDGEFEVTKENGVSSAGIFTRDGINVAYLFQNLRLKPGKYPFWMPRRDWQGRPIPAGDYELRLAESNLRNDYLGMVGNFAKSSDRLDNCSWPEEMIAFDEKDRVIVAQNSFENGMGVRGFDAAFQTPRWMLPGGGGTVGVAIAEGRFYHLQKLASRAPAEKPSYRLRMLDSDTGNILKLPGGEYNRLYTGFSADVYGMASANGQLFISDSTANKIYYASAADPVFDRHIEVASPGSVSFDSKTGLLWVISQEKMLVAIDPSTRQVVASHQPVAAPARLGVNNGRLAYLSRESGKVHILDVVAPAAPKPLREIGTGDGPFGPIKPDRFWFQRAPSGKGLKSEADKIHVSINSKGDVAVVDSVRVLFWGHNGELLKQGMGVWGQHLTMGLLQGDEQPRVWSFSGNYSMKIDSRNRGWEPDILWDLPPFSYLNRAPVGFFTKQGRNFGVYGVKVEGAATRGLAVIELVGHVGKPRTLYFNLGSALAVKHDDNGDGVIDQKDTAIELKGAEATIAPLPATRYDWLEESGDLLLPRSNIPNAVATRVPFRGFDAKGNPLYDWAAARLVGATADGATNVFTSPYDFHSKEQLGNSVMQLAPLNDGGFVSCFRLKSSIGTGLGNGQGTDLAGFTKEGRMRWLHPLSLAEGMSGVQSIPQSGLTLSMMATSCDYFVLDKDGLGLGVLSMARETGWHGMWSDHANQQLAFTGNDGKPYYLLGDYALNGYHWFAIEGASEIRKISVPFRLVETKAAELAAAKPPEPEPKRLPKVAQPEILVRRLKEAFEINGDSGKWLKAGVSYSALVTPEAAGGDIKGAEDCSAIIRLAYHGKDLYVQTIVFDDTVTFHQLSDSAFLHDGIEMGINGFMQGYKFDVTKSVDAGAIVKRGRFPHQGMKYFTEAAVPRVVRVVNSSEVPEDTALMQEATGVDLSKSSVIVSEFRLPFEQEEPGGGATTLPEPASGNRFWVGFFINDNDVPGSDVQNFIPWPQTYSPFNVKERGCHATFE